MQHLRNVNYIIERNVYVYTNSTAVDQDYSSERILLEDLKKDKLFREQVKSIQAELKRDQGPELAISIAEICKTL